MSVRGISPRKFDIRDKKKSACEARWEETMSRLDNNYVKEIDAHYKDVLTNFGEGPKMIQVYNKFGHKNNEEEEEIYRQRHKKLENQKKEERVQKLKSKVKEVMMEYEQSEE